MSSRSLIAEHGAWSTILCLFCAYAIPFFNGLHSHLTVEAGSKLKTVLNIANQGKPKSRLPMLISWAPVVDFVGCTHFLFVSCLIFSLLGWDPWTFHSRADCWDTDSQILVSIHLPSFCMYLFIFDFSLELALNSSNLDSKYKVFEWIYKTLFNTNDRNGKCTIVAMW